MVEMLGWNKANSMKISKPRSIGLVPDRFALYRFPVFRALSDRRVTGFDLTIYADAKERLGIRLASRDESVNVGIKWKRISDLYLAGICFWQTRLIVMAVSSKHDTVVYWGEAHRFSTWLSAIVARGRSKKVIRKSVV